MGYIFLNKNYQLIDIAAAFPEDIAYAFFDDDEDIKNFYAGEEYWHRGYMFAFDRPFKKAGAYSYNFKTDKWTNLWDEYWTLKYMANTINYINAMKPICARFNPTDEDKARFVEFIKNLEDK